MSRAFSRVLATAWAVAAAGALPGLAWASEHGAGDHGPHGIDTKSLVLQFLNFGVLLFLLVKFGGRALRTMLRSRHETLKADLEAARRAREIAEARLREQDRRLANLEAEIEALRTTSRQAAQAEKERLVALAEDKVRRIQAETRFLVEQQIRVAEQGFRAEVAAAAAQLAEQLVRDAVGVADHARLIDGFVGELGATTTRPDSLPTGRAS